LKAQAITIWERRELLDVSPGTKASQRPVHFPFSHELNVGQLSMSQVSTRVGTMNHFTG